MADALLPVKAQGFHAFKIGWGPFGKKSVAVDEAIVSAAREAVGKESLLMVDAGASDAFWPQNYKWALRTAEMLAGFDVTWFEEPLHPDALADYVALRRAARVPIAGGEVLTRRQSFQPWLEAGAFDIVQPDVTKCGGLSEQRRIAWMAQNHGVRFIPHGWNTAVGLASDLQIVSAFPDTDLVEYLTGSPFIDELASAGWLIDSDGMLAIPDKPGLGIEIDLDALAEFSRSDKLELS
jgi:D-galactarolactone cycloisomerase